MSRFTSGILLIVILIGTFGSLFLYVDYEVNKNEIIAEHCVNKDKPELNCNGLCYLKIQLESIDLGITPTDLPGKKKEKEELKELIYTLENTTSRYTNLSVVKKSNQFYYKCLSTNRITEDLFRPPQS